MLAPLMIPDSVDLWGLALEFVRGISAGFAARLAVPPAPSCPACPGCPGCPECKLNCTCGVDLAIGFYLVLFIGGWLAGIATAFVFSATYRCCRRRGRGPLTGVYSDDSEDDIQRRVLSARARARALQG